MNKDPKQEMHIYSIVDQEFEVKGKRKWERPKKTWKMQVEKESKSVGLEKDDALNRVRWKVGIGGIAVRVGYIWPPPFTRINPRPDQNWMMIMMMMIRLVICEIYMLHSFILIFV